MDLNGLQEESCSGARKLPCQEERLFPADSAHSVFIQHVDEDGSLWVMLQSELQIMDVISEALNNTPIQKTVFNPVLNQAVSALNEDSVRYRAVIKRIEPDLCVRFIDFGDELVVTTENLAPLPPTLTVIPPLAMKVQLPVDSKIIPIIGASLLVRHVRTGGGVVTVDAVLPEPAAITPDSTECSQESVGFPVRNQSDVGENASACEMSVENPFVELEESLAPPVESDSQLDSVDNSSKPCALNEKFVDVGELHVPSEVEPQEILSEKLDVSVIPVVLSSVEPTMAVVDTPVSSRDGDKPSESSKENPVENMATEFPVIPDARIESHSVLEKVLDNNSLIEKSCIASAVAGTEVDSTISEEGELLSSSKGSSVTDSKDSPQAPSQSELVSAPEQNCDISQESAHECAFDPFITALGRYPHLGGGYAQETLHANGYVDIGGAGDGRVNPNVNTNVPRKITKGRNSPNFRSFGQDYFPQSNSCPVPSKNDCQASSSKLVSQKNIRSSSPQDFKTILEFELSIVREQNRLQMLQLQKKMEKDLANNMKAMKEELTAFRNEVNGKLMMINDSVVHKMADIYSDIALLKNDQELKRGKHSSQHTASSGQVHQYQSTRPHNMQSFSTNSLGPPESTNTFKNNQSHYDNRHRNPNGMNEFQSNSHNQHQRQASESFHDKDSNDMDSFNVPPNRLMSERKEKMMDRENPHRQQPNFSVGQFNPHDYPKVDYFDPSKTGLEADTEAHSKKGASGSIVCVNNLCSEKITPDLLFNLFSVYGNVQRVKISAQDKGRAYIEMADPSQAEEVVRHLNNVPLMGLRIHVSRCNFERLNLSRQEFQSNTCKDYTKPQFSKFNRFNFAKWDAQKLYPPSPKLMVANVLSSVTDDKIKGEFAKNGFHIQSISNQTCSNEEKKLVFVTFSSLDEAVNALTFMHLQELSDWMMMRISFAKL